MDKKYKVIDLFSGCGGLSFGFGKQSYEIVAGLDNWQDSLVTFEKNHSEAKGIITDLGNIKKKDIDSVGKNIDVIVGGPPCQGFSISGKRNPNDTRNSLYSGFVKYVKELMPAVFLFENVPNLVSMDGGRIKDAIIDDFTKLGYDVKYKTLLASDYGVPQNRRRVVFVGMLGNNNFDFPEDLYADPGKKVTCWEALSDLAENSIDDGQKNRRKPLSKYQRLMRKNTDNIYNHQTTNHEEKTVRTIALVPDGGNYKDLPEKLRDTRKVNIAWTRYNSKKPSHTIDTGHRHHFHYKFNRVPTVRESARLQSFPDDFIFYGSKTSQYKQVGNAVPPLLAEALAREIYKALVK